MIFKNSEGSTNIKRVAAEISPPQERGVHPLDYRTVAPKDFEKVLLQRLIHDNETQNLIHYLALASQLKTLGYDIPKMHPELLVEYREKIDAWIDFAARDSIDFTYLKIAAQVDPKAITSHPHSNALREKLRFMQRAKKLPIHGIVAYHVLFPDDRPDDPASFYSEYGDLIRNSTELEGKSVGNVLEKIEFLANARLAGMIADSPLTAKDWERVREVFAQFLIDPAAPANPRIAAAIRILAAKEIHIDGSGVHFIDPEPVDTISAPTTREKPPHKHI